MIVDVNGFLNDDMLDEGCHNLFLSYSLNSSSSITKKKKSKNKIKIGILAKTT
jgi:outer membrane usher protein FimD/PapC